MSIANEAGIRSEKLPPSRKDRLPCEETTRVKGRRLLRTKEALGLKIPALARFVNQPRETVRDLVNAAVREREAENDAARHAAESPVVHATTGLTECDIQDLRETFLKGTPDGDLAEVVEFFRRLGTDQMTADDRDRLRIYRQMLRQKWEMLVGERERDL